ncbi:MAG: polysaccharide pyruvyl transferase family protein [Candidatus Gracilibacteria bacterium]|nr:polysaccharide pyruvyl transferase family protein [Candidatus Gracilibacteria bacterium]
MKISILMSIGAQNLGDELILKNEIKLLEKKYGKDTQFIVFSYDYKNPFYKTINVKYKEYFPINIKNPKNLFRNIKNYFVFIREVISSRKIIIGGGGIIYDNEVQSVKNPLLQWLFRVNIASLFRKDIIFWAVGINIKNNKNLKFIEKIFKKAKKIYVRDEFSHNLLKKLDIKSEIIWDPVFYDNNFKLTSKSSLVNKFQASNFNLEDIKKSDYNFKNKKVGIALRSKYINNEIIEIEKIIEYLLEKKAEIICIPHSFHNSDKLANDYVFLKYFSDKYNLKITKNMQESYEIYLNNEIDINFAMRLHSIILSHVYEIDYIAISYSKKTDEITKKL